MNLIARGILHLSSAIAMSAFLSACSAASIPQTFEALPNDSFEPGAGAAPESLAPTICVSMGEGARCFGRADGEARRSRQRVGTGSRRPAETVGREGLDAPLPQGRASPAFGYAPRAH